jgi:hypothetical protein
MGAIVDISTDLDHGARQYLDLLDQSNHIDRVTQCVIRRSGQRPPAMARSRTFSVLPEALSCSGEPGAAVDTISQSIG